MRKLTLILLATLSSFVSCKEDKSKKIEKIGDTTVETKMEFGEVHNLSAVDFKKAIDKEGATLIDVRTPEEFTGETSNSEGHIKGAVMVDWYERTFQNYILNFPLDKPILIYCRSGNRTGKATATLQTLGFKEIYNLDKGIIDWKAAKLSFISGDTEVNKAFQKKMKTSNNDVEAAIAKVVKSGAKIYHVTSKDFQSKIDKGYTLVDIRTPDEFSGKTTDGHLKGAVMADWYERTFKSEIEKFDKNQPILIYCRSGNRSAKAASAMQAMGFKEVYNLKKGIKEWKAEGREFVKDVSVEKK
jgi:rhodanese-related sulfurtransferase